MADKHPEHLLSSAPDPNRPAASPSPSAAHASLSRTVPAAVHSRPSDPDRRPSASSTSDMQVDHDAQYSVDAASPAMALGLGLVGAPVHPSPDTAAGATHSDDSHATGDGAHRQLAARRSLPEDARSGSLPPRSTAPALQTTPVHSRQSAEDIHMSESPDLAAGGRGFHRPLDLGSESASPHPSAQHDDEDDEDEDDEDADDDADGSKKHDGVSMPAKSALLYHAGYNSGRGAVWRFFRVVEARVSGNTDRAECLLCNKRMLGKSADMKKHIVHNCPSRNEISEDMLPILAIVKAELENPKKRAKRNSTTPLTLQIDGSFGPVTPTYAPARADHAPPATRAYPGPVRKTPPPPRTPTHPHGSPYDLQQHHRTKITKYPREYMHGGGSGHYETMAGGSEYPSGYAHSPSAMSVPMAGRPQPMPPAPDPRMRPPPPQGGGYPARHGGHPLGPPHVVHSPHHHHHHHHHASQQTAISPPQPQPHVRYYPPSGSQMPPPTQQPQQPQPQQQGRQPAPPPPAPLSAAQVIPVSTTPSPQISGSSTLLTRLRAKLQRRMPVFGVWLTIPSSVTARAMAAQGFDWACIDMEHTPLSPVLMAEMVAAVASSGTCVPIVRVPSHSPEWFKWALDAGAHGVIVPMVNTAEELLRAQRLCRYPPAGQRSMGAFFAPGVFGLRGPRAVSDYVEYASKDILVIPQIGSVEGAANLPAMLKAGGTDAVFVGPYDLSASVRGTPDMQVQDVMAHIEQSAKDHDVPLGIYAAPGAAAGAKCRDGYSMIVAASDIECLLSSATDSLDRARSEARVYR